MSATLQKPPIRQNRPIRQRGNKAITSTAGTTVGIVLLIVVAAIFLIPLVWLVSAAFKPNAEIYQWPLTLIPSKLTFENFVEAMTAAPLLHFFFNSLVLVVVGTVVKTVLAVLSAYAFVFLDFPGKNILFLAMLGVLMVPGNVTLVLNYVTIGNLGLVNTFAGILLPGIGSAFGMFLLRQHFMGMPQDVFEAAELDGAGTMRKLFSFVIPLAKPSIITVALLAAIEEWNSFIWPLIVTNTDDMRTVSLGLMYLKQQDGLQQWGPIMAGTLLMIIPVLLLFMFAQRYIVSGMVGAAMK